jgi:DNA transposition AAA+ family ATPase
MKTEPTESPEITDPNARMVQPVRATWPFSSDTLLENMATYTEETRETMLACFRWCIDPKHLVSRQEFARRVDYHETNVWKFFAGRYLHPETKVPEPPPEKFLRAARQFLKLERERYEGGRTVFVATQTSQRINTFFDLVRESRSMGVMWGPSHVGKTWAAEEYRQGNNHGRTIYVRMHAASGLGGMVRRIADCLGISDNANTAALVERIKRGLTVDTLLILDECHLLANTYRANSFFACIEVIREIHDESGCGMVLIWTRIDSLKQASGRELQQVWRRGVHKLSLPPSPTRADVAAVLAASGLRFPEKGSRVKVGKVEEDPAAVLAQVAKGEGLKAITERLRYARKLANKGSGVLTWEDFIKAHLTILSQATPPEDDWA